MIKTICKLIFLLSLNLLLEIDMLGLIDIDISSVKINIFIFLITQQSIKMLIFKSRATLSISIFSFLFSWEPGILAVVWWGRTRDAQVWTWRWSSMVMDRKSRLEVSSGFRAAWDVWRGREGVGLKEIEAGDLQTLLGEGGANRRLDRPSRLLPHSAQGCVLGLEPLSR